MSIDESIQSITRLFLDTAPVIYLVEQNTQYLVLVRAVFQCIREGSPIAVTSPVTLAECLVHPYTRGDMQQNFIQLITNTKNIDFVSINQNIALQAAELRARYNLSLTDAFQVAVALATNCESFLTNDAMLKRVTELQILVLNDFLDPAE
ncbi:MAG: PIN domain-containing protein [Hormoscilla sp. GM102CHS1]|nr:PIN domain-containing protein [Hormoscilla sp. GM102CHS1]